MPAFGAGWQRNVLPKIPRLPCFRFLGPGRPFAPEAYTIACLSFDLLVAAYVAIAIGVGRLRGRGSNRRRVA